MFLPSSSGVLHTSHPLPTPSSLLLPTLASCLLSCHRSRRWTLSKTHPLYFSPLLLPVCSAATEAEGGLSQRPILSTSPHSCFLSAQLPQKQKVALSKTLQPDPTALCFHPRWSELLSTSESFLFWAGVFVFSFCSTMTLSHADGT